MKPTNGKIGDYCQTDREMHAIWLIGDNSIQICYTPLYLVSYTNEIKGVPRYYLSSLENVELTTPAYRARLLSRLSM